MLKITDEILANLQTDSDVMELSEETGVPFEEIMKAIYAKKAEGTPCEGCKHVSCHGLYPCNACSRGKQDFYTV